MGLRDLLGQAAGPSEFGSTFGRSVVENGFALGRTLYLGHGIDKSTSTSGSRIFADAIQMHSAGFDLYCSDPTNLPAEDSSALSIHCRAVSMALATHLGMFCSRYFSKQDSKSAFNRAMGSGTAEKLRQLNSDVTVELFQRYTHMTIPSGLKFVNKEIPGEADLLGFYMNEAAKTSSTCTIGFQRTGILGFAALSVALMDQTITAFEDALAKFHW
jgi:hypothetical protein